MTAPDPCSTDPAHRFLPTLDTWADRAEVRALCSCGWSSDRTHQADRDDPAPALAAASVCWADHAPAVAQAQHLDRLRDAVHDWPALDALILELLLYVELAPTLDDLDALSLEVLGWVSAAAIAGQAERAATWAAWARPVIDDAELRAEVAAGVWGLPHAEARRTARPRGTVQP